MNNETEKNSITRMSKENLKDFVLKYCDGKIFTSFQIKNKSDIIRVFMVLIGIKKIPDNVAIIWEYIDQALSRSINGYPIFFSCRFMHVEDWKIVVTAINKEIDRRKNVEIEL